MSRLLKFRAWDGKQFLPLTREVAFIDDNGVLCSRIEGIVFEQFTGLVDRLGKEIYEGDIVLGLYDARGVVTWNEQFGSFAVFSPLKNTSGYYHLVGIWEVLGNIHEHPELMES